MTATCELNNGTANAAQSKYFSRLTWKRSFAVSNLTSQTVGVVLMACSLGLWFTPGAVYDPQTLMIKVGLSLVSAIGGIALFQSARHALTPDVEFDRIRREIRFVRRGTKTDEVLNTVSFDNLVNVEMSNGTLKANDKTDGTQIELSIDDPKAFQALRRQLTPSES